MGRTAYLERLVVAGERPVIPGICLCPAVSRVGFPCCGLAALVLQQLTWAALPLLLAALLLVKRDQRRLLVWLGGTAVFYFILAFTYQPNDAILLTLPAWLLLTLVLAASLPRLGWLALSLPLLLLLLNFQPHNLSGDKALRERAEALLTAVPPGAIVQTNGDPTIFALWYFVYTEGQRPDIIPVDADLFAHEWYRARLARRHPDLTGLTKMIWSPLLKKMEGNGRFAPPV
ncbi:MAG: hypothetical protein M5U34_45840 [Chloroflexi bacterium]|nr:hypothetical protein [Chloroflexota bacterium]